VTDRKPRRERSRLRRIFSPFGWRGEVAGLFLLFAVLTALYAPAALAFPHYQRFGPTSVYSTEPILAVMAQRIARADTLLAASPLHEPGLERTIVLTDGGWRWKLMSVGYWNVIALRRPFSSTLIFNRSDVAADRISNGAAIGGVRTLSGTIAHETAHVLTAKMLGEWRFARLPQWKREGYADYVAQETSVGRDDEARIRARNPKASVLAYYEGRRRVAARLAQNGGSLEELFSD
jgi:hypothetical protein